MNSNKNLSNIKTELLIAMIFLILTLIGSAVFFVFFMLAILFVSSAGGPPILPPIGFLGLIFFIPALIVLLRVRDMQSAVEQGDIDKLKSLNSLGVAIIALILTGIIPGIMLLIAYSEINQLNTEMSQVDPMERINGLKQLLDEGIIGKEEFEAKKASVLKAADPTQSKLEDMRKLKEMRDQGLLTEDEYEKMKKQLLSKF